MTDRLAYVILLAGVAVYFLCCASMIAKPAAFNRFNVWYWRLSARLMGYDMSLKPIGDRPERLTRAWGILSLIWPVALLGLVAILNKTR